LNGSWSHRHGIGPLPKRAKHDRSPPSSQIHKARDTARRCPHPWFGSPGCGRGADALSEERAEDAIYYFAGIDGARFKKPVLPGDQLIMTAKLERGRAGIYKFAVQATVDGEIAAEANITCAVRTKGA